MQSPVTQSMDYVLQNWLDMAAICWEATFTFCAEKRPCNAFVVTEEPRADVEEWTRYLSTGGLVSDISWLIRKRERDTVFPRVPPPARFFFFFNVSIVGGGGVFESRNNSGGEFFPMLSFHFWHKLRSNQFKLTLNLWLKNARHKVYSLSPTGS